jgi:Predicted acetamidase/formamidase
MLTKLFAIYLAAAAAQASDLSGNWMLHLIRGGEEVSPARVELKVENGKLTGTLNELALTGTVQGEDVEILATRPNGDEFGKLKGKIVGADLKGTVQRGSDEMGWVMRRMAVVNTPPRTHTFVPAVFHRVFSGSIEPALHINPGDTVKTTTVDAGGRDEKGASRVMGGNPETGPFYVEGAMPGDTLSIRFNRIRLNRDSAGSGDRIVPSAVNAGYYRDAKFAKDFSSEWKLDREKGLGSLAKPTERLKNFRVPLRPMLGCVGVAPPEKQSFRAGWLGPWGGNMDYNGIQEGTTLYLPVFQIGALLFIGDGHAAEGDGELTGDALETSMEVEFTVNLISGNPLPGPRAENSEYLMAMGIAGSLQDALQQATTQLARWIEKDYKLNANESAMVLGTSIRYDIAEVVDPQVNIVAKISKAALAQIGK